MRTPRTLHLYVLLLALLAAGVALWLRCAYPKGHRPCSLPCVVQALRSYAYEHGGMFPTDQGNQREALRKLYPRYLPNPEPLAGLTGNRGLLKGQLEQGIKLTEAASSWVYWPGLRLEDNPDIAIIWESEPGLGSGGEREPGHAVGFIAGNIRQVPDADWQAFLSEQDFMRAQALKARKAD